MNKLLTTISCTLLVCACEAQTMRVWMKDGSERQFAVSEIERVTFSEEETSMEQLKKEIEQFLDDWNDAMIAADTVRLGTMMDDGIILRHITGMTQTKHEWLEEVASGSMKYHKIEKRDVVVTSNSDGSASVSFTSVITATIWGSYGTWTLSGTMRLVKRNGDWIRIDKRLPTMRINMLISAILSFSFLTACASCSKGEDSDGAMNVGTQTSSETDTTTTADVPMLLYMGQASIRITTEEGRVIYIDPYAGNGYDLAADLILVTHEHFDHNAVDKVRNRQEGCRIIRARDAVIDGVRQTFDLGYVKVEAVEAGYNRYHDVRSCAGYVLTFNNGQKVYVSGDTSTTKQMERMPDMHIDYAFLCTDGLYNMDNEEAAEAAHMIKARHNIPYHNDTSNRGEMFDRDAAERFDAPNKMIVLPGETIRIE